MPRSLNDPLTQPNPIQQKEKQKKNFLGYALELPLAYVTVIKNNPESGPELLLLFLCVGSCLWLAAILCMPQA